MPKFDLNLHLQAAQGTDTQTSLQETLEEDKKSLGETGQLAGPLQTELFGLVPKPINRVSIATHLVNSDMHAFSAIDRFRKDSGKVFGSSGGGAFGSAGQLYWLNKDFKDGSWYQFTNLSSEGQVSFDLIAPLSINNLLENPTINQFGGGHPILHKIHDVIRVIMYRNKPYNEGIFSTDNTVESPSIWATGFYGEDPGDDKLDLQQEEVDALTNKEKFQIWLQWYFDWSSPSAAYAELPGIETGVASRAYYDHACTIPTPFFKKDIEDSLTANEPVFANIVPNYNYFLESYEVFSQIPATAILPNLYIFRSEMKNEQLYNNAYDIKGSGQYYATGYTDLTTLGDNDQGLGKKLILKNKENVKTYFKHWSDKVNSKYATLNEVNSLTTRQKLESLGRKYKNLIFDAAELNSEDCERYKKFFPLSIDLEFTTDNKTAFADTLKKRKLDIALIQWFIQNGGADGDINPDDTHRYVSVFDILKTRQYVADSPLADKEEFKDEQQLKVWDFKNWWTGMLNDTPNDHYLGRAGGENVITGTGEFIGFEAGASLHHLVRAYIRSNSAIITSEPNGSEKIAIESSSKSLKTLMASLLGIELKKLIIDKSRSFWEILKGKKAYNETLFYRVEKKLDNEIVQQFWIPNSSDLDICRMYDTQVAPGKVYEYTIFAYQLVVGSQYTYTNNAFHANGAINGAVIQTSSTFNSAIGIETVPSVKIIEVEYYKQNVLALDSPGISPDAEFIPYRADKNKFCIKLNAGIGNMDLEPIIIEQEDVAIFDKIRQAQVKDTSELITFKTEDPPSYFEIFRIDTQPATYTDFRDKRITTVNSLMDRSRCLRSYGASFIETKFATNKKYYYTFRTVDMHGNISNPTPVYQVEMVDDAGFIYLDVKIVDLKVPMIKKMSKPMRKYLHIAPAFAQMVIDAAATNLIGNQKHLELGEGLSEKVWDEKRKFKIRLSSKSTGKKIDVNIQFKKSYTTQEPDQALCGEGILPQITDPIPGSPDLSPGAKILSQIGQSALEVLKDNTDTILENIADSSNSSEGEDS